MKKELMKLQVLKIRKRDSKFSRRLIKILKNDRGKLKKGLRRKIMITPYGLLTNSQAESYNSKIKRIVDFNTGSKVSELVY